MTAYLHKHRRLYAVGILLAFLAAWVLPVQAGVVAAAHATSQPSCPDCPTPCSSGDCCATMAAVCGATAQPVVAAQSLSPAKALPAPALHPGFAPQPDSIEIALAPPEWASSHTRPTTLNIRFCTFQN